MKQKSPWILLALTSALLVLSCSVEEADKAASKDSVEATFSSLYNAELKNCGGANCHNRAAGRDDLDFSSKEKAYASIVGVARSEYTDISESNFACDAAILVEPGQPNASLVAGALVEKIRDQFTVAGCTPNLTGHIELQAEISAAAQEALIKWIENGAKNN